MDKLKPKKKDKKLLTQEERNQAAFDAAEKEYEHWQDEGCMVYTGPDD